MPSQEAKHLKQQQSKPNSVPGRVSYLCVIPRSWSCWGVSPHGRNTVKHAHMSTAVQSHISTDAALRMQPSHAHLKRSKSRSQGPFHNSLIFEESNALDSSSIQQVLLLFGICGSKLCLSPQAWVLRRTVQGVL